MKAVLIKIGNALKNNLWLKIASLVFACILWSYVITVTNPVRDKTVYNVPVSFTHVEELEAKGITINGDLADILSEVSVTVSSEQNNHGLISANVISANVDLSTVNGSGTFELMVQANIDGNLGTVVNVNPSKITIKAEDLVRKILPVEAVVIGEAPEGYVIGKPTVSSDQIEILGARSVVSSISKAVCYIYANEITSKLNQSFNLSLLSENGDIVDESNLKDYVPSVIVNMDVYHTKQVSVNIDGLISASPPQGYKIASVTVSPNTVIIADDDDFLSKISFVQPEQINVSDLTAGTHTIKTTIKSIEGLYYISDREIEVTVDIQPK